MADPFEVFCRANYHEEVAHLTQIRADVVIMGENEIARSMTESLTQKAFNNIDTLQGVW
ncbi:hypothetical protein [Rhizobium sp. FKL33]|uniref:hypothetical protein n=1 Tax=Rhizobium sp. FKL33 TaxID=2562307 RepID=UPI0014853DAC|nr:hypothetical protein [Rhizobium sp. FKL33]